ncbi:MAG: hypothetical protein RMY62_010855 [Nostoc sp. ZfuVER08]|nr:hypothetical protein [Nostoc sp. ZfuVER08]
MLQRTTAFWGEVMPDETPAPLSAGIHETIVEGIAVCWGKTKIAVLNAIAVDCIANTGVISLPRLPDNPYQGNLLGNFWAGEEWQV